MKDLCIAYRICAQPSKNAPNNFSKLECLKSFKKALGNLDVFIYVILDNCPKEYEEAFLMLWHFRDLEFIHTCLGNAGTFRKSVEVLLKQSKSTIVYFAEDDYLYQPCAIESAYSVLLKCSAPDFLTLYNHPDYQNQLIHKLDLKMWTERRSTTLTFMARKSSLKDARCVFINRLSGTSDFARWLALTKTGMFNPMTLLRWLPHKFLLYSFVTSWLFHGWQILFGRRYLLFACSPSQAEHQVKQPEYLQMAPRNGKSLNGQTAQAKSR